MKKITVIVLAMVVFGVGVGEAQDSTVAKIAEKTFFAELGGNGMTLSLNFDTRFPGLGNLGARAGIGYIQIGDFSMLTLPVLLNYLAGKNGKYFEIGGGIVYSNEGFFESYGEYDKIYGTLTFGYRLQPTDGGFSFRVALTPFFGTEGDKFFFVPYYPGISFGYAF